MIRVDRDRTDSRLIQQKLNDVRLEKLPKLRKLVRDGLPSSDQLQPHLTGYQIAKDHLWENQYGRCCYCEKWEERSGNDVEHYRPKIIYWWLAFTWTNLLFACEQCNSRKNAQFELLSGERLKPEDAAPGNEVPLLLDPSDTRLNPVEHIEFKWKPYLVGGPRRWVAEPRKSGKDSAIGDASVGVYGLNRADLFERRDHHVRSHVKPFTDRLQRYLERDQEEAKRTFVELIEAMKPGRDFVALTYDACRHFVSDDDLKPIRCSWPQPSEVGLLGAPRPQRRAARIPKR